MSAPKPSLKKYSLSAFPTFFSKPYFRFRLDAEFAVYGFVSGGFWFIPLLNRLHVESMAVLAAVTFFVGGYAATHRFRQGEHMGSVLSGRLFRLFLPWGMLTVSILWAPNCDYFRGLLFLPLFPGITAFLAVCAAYFITTHKIRFRYLAIAGVAVMVVGPIYDIGFHPQFYSYNHVFGGVLGPLYDETLAVRAGLFWFRGLTLAWACLLILAARRRLGLDAGMTRIFACVVAIGLMYLSSAYLGFNTPAWYLQKQLSGVRQTEHFAIHYDPHSQDLSDVEHWAVEHEYRYAQLRERLDIDVDGRIHSYVYPDASVRASLTGARYTSVAPVWLREPQVHILANQIQTVFPHELAHVFSREFGIPFVRASISVGLIEGLAVATEPPDGRPTPHEMVASSSLFRESENQALAERLAGTLSASGFWSGRGAVSYTVSGSFVSFLIDKYGVDSFKTAYPLGSFRSVYGKSGEELALEWIAFLESVPSIDRSAAWRAEMAFSAPSLFEQYCPHWVPPPVRREAEAVLLLEDGRVPEALEIYQELVTRYPEYLPGREGWAKTKLGLGRIAGVIDTLQTVDRSSLSLAGTRILGDAFALSSESDSATTMYESVRIRLPLYARDSRAIQALRKRTAIYPDLIRTVVSTDSIHIRRERLSSVLVEREIETNSVVGPGLIWQAMLAAEDRAWSDALVSLESALSLPGGPCSAKSDPAISIRCPVWAAAYAYRLGDLERALAYAASAKNGYLAKGDLAAVRVLGDFLAKLNWLLENRASLD